jgi:hypothetical protein
MAENTNVRFNIPTNDLKALKELARQRGVTLTSVVHEAVRLVLNTSGTQRNSMGDTQGHQSSTEQ